MRKRQVNHADGGDEPIIIVDDLPSRAEILGALETLGKPSGLRAIADHLHVSGKPALNALKRRMGAMRRDGQLITVRGGRFAIPDRLDLISGTIIAHPDGYAFVQPDRGGDDIYLAPREAHQVFHDDQVLVRVAGHDRRGRPYGNVAEVTERGHDTVVGRFLMEGGVGYLEPDDHRIHQEVVIPESGRNGAAPGVIVSAVIEQYPRRRSPAIGRITEILGEHLAPGMEIEIALRNYQLPVEWSENTQAELGRLGPLTEAECGGRLDLRHLPMVTIDGEDARDFDDAVYARETEKGFVLTVAIADVGHYVAAGTALDDDAELRGTSVYFPNQVVPMLPERLSNDLCSLVPGEDRPALVCEINLDRTGEIGRSRFHEAVIRSHHRFTYEEVQALADGASRDESGPPASVVENVNTLYKVFDALDQARRARGALEIDVAEPQIIFDAGRKIRTIAARQRCDAHRLIEVCMIAANVAAAEFLMRHQAPTLFRVHDEPDDERIDGLRQVLNELGVRFDVTDGAVTPLDLMSVLALARERDDQHLIETLVLRSQKLAVYSEENRGHFGLGLEAYCHFTSPIRRYPDLLVHRQIKAILNRSARTSDDMAELASHCSRTERRAEEATRDVIKWLKCEFMQDRIGEKFAATISGVAEFGLFVELDGVFVEGLLHVSELPGDYYRFDAGRHVLKGHGSGNSFRLGQSIEVMVARVDLDQRRIDFSWPQGDKPKRRSRKNGDR